MKKMGLAVAIFFGVILLTSTVVISLPGLMQPLETRAGFTFTGTPADNYMDIERDQFCGVGQARSNTFVKEYKVPTECTNPMAITTDRDGNVWFAQSNTGMLARFDPLTESFSEYENMSWPQGARTMMWGIDYAPDGKLWFTDDALDAVWQFSPSDESYGVYQYPPGDANVMPQKIQVLGSNVVFNDFMGGSLVILTPAGDEANLLTIPPIINGSNTSDFATDEDRNIWFTSWIPDSGLLAKFDYGGYEDAQLDSGATLGDYVEVFALPEDATTINGVELSDGLLWLADTSSSYFFAFDPASGQFTKFVTSDPPLSSYGNSTGIIKSPISRPYWVEATDDGRIVFNEQGANRIAVFDPAASSLVEYDVPSKNPNWADCGMLEDCGTAQVFGFTVDGEKVWFTEWVENNIGVVDMSVALPFDVALDNDAVFVVPENPATVEFKLVPGTQQELSDLTLISAATDELLSVDVEFSNVGGYGPQDAVATIDAGQFAESGIHRVLLGAQTGEVTIGKFVTVTVVK